MFRWVAALSIITSVLLIVLVDMGYSTPSRHTVSVSASIYELPDGRLAVHRHRDDRPAGSERIASFSLSAPCEQRGLPYIRTTYRYGDVAFSLIRARSSSSPLNLPALATDPSELTPTLHKAINEYLVDIDDRDLLDAWRGELPEVRYLWGHWLLIPFQVGLLILIPYVILIARRSVQYRVRLKNDCCWHCGYDLRAHDLDELCPECGEPTR